MGEADCKSLIAKDPESAAKTFVDKDRQIQVIPRSPEGVGLLTSILISKYQDHQPLHRQEEMSARFGYEVPRNRMREWLGALSELCLYRAEQKDCNSAETQAIRSKVSAPLVLELHKYLTAWSNRTLPRSPVQKAIHYALTQWEALTLFLVHPHVRLDNSLIENQMRPIALGRKNWLFAGSHEGAMRAAIFFSIINFCRMNNVNTWEYFTDVLPRLSSAASEDLPKLLPHVWQKPFKDGG